MSYDCTSVILYFLCQKVEQAWVGGTISAMGDEGRKFAILVTFLLGAGVGFYLASILL